MNDFNVIQFILLEYADLINFQVDFLKKPKQCYNLMHPYFWILQNEISEIEFSVWLQ